MKKLSDELKYKIKMEMIISYKNTMEYVEYSGRKFGIPGSITITGILNFNTEEEYIYQECIYWGRNLEKIDIGRFYGIFPIELREYEVKFSIDFCDEESWKDWFIND